MHLDDDGVSALAARYGVPLDAVFAPSDTRFLPQLFKEISYEPLIWMARTLEVQQVVEC